jgi:hypothetical protein
MARLATMTVDARRGPAPHGAGHDANAAEGAARAANGEQTDRDDPAQAMQDRADAALDGLDRRKAGARRTAWIIAAIAVAFFIASLLQGHFAHIPH